MPEPREAREPLRIFERKAPPMLLHACCGGGCDSNSRQKVCARDTELGDCLVQEARGQTGTNCSLPVCAWKAAETVERGGLRGIVDHQDRRPFARRRW